MSHKNEIGCKYRKDFISVIAIQYQNKVMIKFIKRITSKRTVYEKCSMNNVSLIHVVFTSVIQNPPISHTTNGTWILVVVVIAMFRWTSLSVNWSLSFCFGLLRKTPFPHTSLGLQHLVQRIPIPWISQ